MLLGPPTQPPSSLVYRIERRHSVRLPQHATFTSTPASRTTHSAPFFTPVPHLWSLLMPDGDRQHVVLLHDHSDAITITRAIAAYTRMERHVPWRYEHLKALFSLYYGQSHPSHNSKADDFTDLGTLGATQCDVDATLRWALPRGIGVLSLAKITRHPIEMQFVVPMTIVSIPEGDAHFDGAITADALRTAFAEDFRWQLG